MTPSSRLGTDCIRCRRWKIFDDKPCSQHPNFKTFAELQWQEAERNMSVMMYVAALRCTAYLGQSSRLEKLWRSIPEAIMDRVVADMNERGLMTDNEFTTSLLAYGALQQKIRNS